MRIWFRLIIPAVLAVLLPACSTPAPPHKAAMMRSKGGEPIVATYSIVAYDPKTGDLGVAVQSKFFGVGTVVPWAKADVGAVATQAAVNVRFGPSALKLLGDGKSPEEAVKQLTEADPEGNTRQLGMVDAQGRAAAFTGSECLDFAGNIVRKNFSVQGNILAGRKVLEDMAAAFERSQQEEGTELADSLVAALQAGEDAGGDRRGRQSAALLVVRNKGGYDRSSDRFIDLRIEDHPNPTREMARLLAIHKEFYAEEHARKPVK